MPTSFEPGLNMHKKNQNVKKFIFEIFYKLQKNFMMQCLPVFLFIKLYYCALPLFASLDPNVACILLSIVPSVIRAKRI